MHRFRRRFGRTTTTVTALEASLLGDLVDQLRSLLAERRAAQSDDPLAALTGMTVASAEPPEDTALRRLLPDFSPDPQTAAGLRQLHEPALLAAKDEAAATVQDTLPRGGGTIRLDDAQAAAWMTALNDLRLTIGERIGVTEEGEPEALQADPEGPVAALWHTYQWLSAVLDSLVVAVAE